MGALASSHVGFECSLAGLTINPQYPFLGASPDGFSYCECCGDGIIEIKCPFSLKEGKPGDLISKKNSFLNDVRLIQTHKILYPSSGSTWKISVILLSGHKMAYSLKDYIKTHVLLKKWSRNLRRNMLPELLTHRLQILRKQAPLIHAWCQGKEYGRMIECENPTCKYGWFHFTCIGLNRAPKGSWYCDECRTEMTLC